MNIEQYNRTRTKKYTLKKSVKNFINRILLTTIIFLICLIAVNKNQNFKKSVIENVYEKNFEFLELRNIYDKYVKDLIGIKNPTTKTVFTEKLSYSEAKTYKDGVSLTVADNYLVPILNSGIVIFIGEKEGYGNTVIIEQVDGIDVWYSNISNMDVKMYDYVEKGKLLGECTNNKLYLVFQKDGKTLDYKDYI